MRLLSTLIFNVYRKFKNKSMRQKSALIEPLWQPPSDSTLWDKVVPTTLRTFTDENKHLTVLQQGAPKVGGLT
jgi:hypothetical protein